MEICCLLGICCPPEEQLAALVSLFRAHGNMDEAGAAYSAQHAMDALEAGELAPLLSALKHWHKAKKNEQAD